MNRYREYLLRALPFAAAFVLFFGISALYFSPQFAGEELPQHDVMQYEGMVRDIRLQRAETGEDPQWTGGMFGGMPAYLINVAYPAQAVKNTVGAVVRVIDAPAAFLFFAMLGMWLMLLMVGVNPWVGIVAALAYGLSTYLLLIIGAGHVTKSWALVYAPLMMGGIYCTLRRNPWIGGAATALFASLQIGVNHPQITYYFLMAAALFWLSEGFFALRGKRLRDFAKRTAVLLAAGVLAVGSNFSPLWYTLQHTRDTIRGGSELAAADKSDGASGLDLEYATAWSYGPAESWNLLIPDFMGGDSMRSFSSDGEVAGALREYGLSELAGQLPAYWGDQPFTAGPTYLGAVSLFLALMGCLLARGRDKWWAIAATVLALLLAWGRHFMPFTELFFTYLPGYDKFRTVSMILVIAQWTVPLLGAVGLMYLWRNREEDRTRFRRALAWSLGVVGGLCLLFAVAGSAIFDFGRQAAEEQMTATFGNWFRQAGMTAELRQGLDAELGRTTAEAMAAERVSIMQADAWRSFVFVLLAAGAVFLYLRRWCGRGVLVALLGVWMAVDLVTVDLRYLSADDFVPARRNRVMPTEADRRILQDKEPGYRVLNLTVSPFNDATTSYFHRSVGGYHGAKLARYQDLIEWYLTDLDESVLDMLNTRYVIVSPDSVIRRETSLGAAWFVEGILATDSAREEIERLGEVDLRRVAVIRRDDLGKSARLEPESKEGGFEGSIRLTEYRPNCLKYEYSADRPAVAVFSEIFYDKGWTAYVDGEEVPAFRADYVLRALQLPAAEHGTVEWRFRAPKWRAVESVTLVSSLAILAGCAAVLVYLLVRRKKEIRE
ncbi:hypothetical protein [uncultured Alistipes sp.]|uniref:hypothetical protein n=1 Tax=uncultured Alistipes sp. TaxID=538949 RepID=UPI002611D528|nr:hypothetical protein [uncultured Alistipes sp.]